MREELARRAKELGFARLGVARVEPLGRDGDALRDWVAKGHHGSMAWMADTLEVRLDPSRPELLEGARSVVVLATPFARAEAPTGPRPAVVARYAQGRDYHNVVGKRMRKLARVLRDAGHGVRYAVDTMPILERAWAQRAGVGFIGKNCCIIVPGLGSHVFLSALITDADLPPDTPMAERCGACELCLHACPTEAFEAPRELDGRRCVSYLTIEHRGPIPTELRAGIGDRLFGCDDCQDVCPFNRTAPPDAALTEPFATDPRLATELGSLIEMDDAQLREWATGSPLRRPGREGLARNGAIVLGNSKDRRHLPVLRRLVSGDPSETVRDAARWAIAEIERE